MTSGSCISNHDEILIFPDKALVWMRVIPIASPQYNHYNRPPIPNPPSHSNKFKLSFVVL